MIREILKIIGSKKVIFIILVLITVPTFISAQNEDETTILLVGFRDEKNVQNISQDYNIPNTNLDEIGDLNVFRVKNPNLLEKAKLYISKTFSDQINFIEEPQKYKAILTPNDYSASAQWGLAKMNATLAWSITTGSTSKTIAILDTGINGLHEDLNGKVTAGKAYLNNGGTTYTINANTDSDDNGHGTSVAGVAAAVTNNNKGIAGTDWNARLMPIKILDSGGSGWDSDIANGIIYAAQNGADVLNMSLGGSSPSSTLEAAVNTAYNTYGCVVVAASGNENTTPISYPARYTNCIAVGATNSSDARCTPSDWGYDWWGNPLGSNYGSNLDVVAPGNSIKTTKDTAAGNEYRTVSGTSLATPFVSGIAALIWANNSSLTNSQVRSYVQGQADKVSGMGGANFHNQYGYGRVDMYDSLNPSPSNDPSDYTYSTVSQNVSPTLIPSDSYRFEVKIKNTGDTIWKRGKVNLGTDDPQDRITGFIREDRVNHNASGWYYYNRILMQESSVGPGATATFSFYMTVPNGMSPGVYVEHFRPVADGITWMADRNIHWNIIIKSAAESYKPYTVTYQSGYPTLSPGQGNKFTLKIRNDGSSTWKRGKVNLAPDRPEDRITGFLREGGNPSGWIYYNRIYLVENQVAPGKIGTFQFWMKPPPGMASGTYHEYFRPVADGVTWMEDKGIYWDITVR